MRKSIIKYKKRIYEFDEITLDIHDMKMLNAEDAKKTLFKTQEILKEFGLDLYLGFGTLLGAVRDKNFIKGDLDIDTFILGGESILFDHLDDLKNKGLLLVRAIVGRTYTFMLKEIPGCYIDVYICKNTFSIWWLWCYRLNKWMVPRRYLKRGNIYFLGREFCCPQNPNEILKFWYGDTWNIPIGKFSKTYTYDVLSHYHYIILKNKIKKMARFILGKSIYSLIKRIVKNEKS